MPYCATEEEFVLRYRRQLEAQSTRQMVPPLQRDEQGVAFSTAEGTAQTQLIYTVYISYSIFSIIEDTLNQIVYRFNWAA